MASNSFYPRPYLESFVRLDVVGINNLNPCSKERQNDKEKYLSKEYENSIDYRCDWSGRFLPV